MGAAITTNASGDTSVATPPEQAVSGLQPGRQTAEIERFKTGVPGLYESIPADVYHALPAVSSTVLKKIHTHSPAHAKDLIDHGIEPSDEMEIGSAGHLLLFTPSEFDEHYMLAPTCEQTVKSTGKPCENSAIGYCDLEELWLCGTHSRGRKIANPNGITILTPDMMERTRGVVAAIRACSKAMAILEAATDFELSVLTIDDETGLLLKARFDILCRDIGVMPDLKTCRSSDPKRFKYQARDLAYQVQLAFYRRVGIAAGLPVEAPVIIAAENTKPFPVTVFEPSSGFMERGVADMTEALRTFAQCEAAGIWPPYATETQVLELP